MDETTLYDVPTLSHEPINPPREGLIGENVFYSEWKKLMEQESPSMWDTYANYHLVQILSPMPGTLTQRHATVAASLMTWLGTNCGRAFLDQAAAFAATANILGSRGDGFLAYWAMENQRKAGHPRTIEHILTPAKDRPGRFASVSGEDMEVAEQIVSWLGSERGLQFLVTCKKKIDAAIEAVRRRKAAEQALADSEREFLRLGLAPNAM